MDGKEIVLEPCPHCGGVPTLKTKLWILKVIVCPDGSPCRDSGLFTIMVEDDEDKAITAYNRRIGR